VCIANLREVRAILSAITDGDLPMARLGQTAFIEAVEIWTKAGLEVVVAQLESIELDQNRAIGRMKIGDAADRLQFEQAKQLSDLLMGSQRNVLIEIDEQGIVARGSKLHSTVFRCGHPGEL